MRDALGSVSGGQRRNHNRKKNRRRRRRLLWAGCTALGVVLVVLLVRFCKGAASGLHTAANYGTAEYDVSAYVFDAADPNLRLVNNNTPLPDGYAPEAADAANGKQLAAAAAAAYQQMEAAAEKDHVSLILCSGYRDYAYQQGLFEKRMKKYEKQGYNEQDAAALAQTVVAKPGCSEHQTGLAADIVTDGYQGLDSGFAKTDAYAWLKRYAADYGFILRYPENRQAATGIIYEPWHWRYVGVENAQAITQSGLSLEEFVALHTTAQDIASAAASQQAGAV